MTGAGATGQGAFRMLALVLAGTARRDHCWPGARSVTEAGAGWGGRFRTVSSYFWTHEVPPENQCFLGWVESATPGNQ